MLTRRTALMGIAAGTAALSTSACTARFGSKSSYLTPILKPEHHGTVAHWVDIVMQQVRDQRVPPPRAAYNFALPMAAGFLAANGVIGSYSEPFGIGQGPRGADPEIAYGTAFAIAAAEAFQQPFLMERLAFKRRFADGEAKRLGVQWGRKVGRAVVQMRTNDGVEFNKVNFYLGRYPRRDDALKWTPTGPFYSAVPGPAFATYARGLFPGLGQIKPWTMTRSSQFRAAEYYDPQSPEFAEEFSTIRALGGADSKIRTLDQSEIALFWEDGPWGITPPGHFLFIALQVLQDLDLPFIEQARAFALLGMTQADAAISAWDSKYIHDVIRPETAIRFRAAAFKNPDARVKSDKTWRSYIPTPEFPAYTSGHSTFGAAGVELTSLLLGTSKVTFSHESPDQVLWPQLKGRRRTWTDLNQAADENGLSRLYGGVHWRLDHTAAMQAGRAIARQAFEKTFPKKV
ncbi:MAG: vanadium-dependent haloperoxidase [Pseudomonadota bacterium]